MFKVYIALVTVSYIMFIFIFKENEEWTYSLNEVTWKPEEKIWKEMSIFRKELENKSKTVSQINFP